MVVSCIVRDITDQRSAQDARVALIREQARREQAEQATRRYHDLVQTLDAIVWEFDPASGDFTFVSHRAEELLGYPVSEWTAHGNFLVEHAHIEHRDDVAVFLDSFAKRKSGELEFRLVASDSSVLWMRTIVQLGRDAQGKSQLRGLMVDTTARRMAENALRNSEKLAATGRLAATVAHEINNPMAAVTNILYLLAGHPTLDDTARKYT
jgi:PAS domain S-box-containing protein